MRRIWNVPFAEQAPLRPLARALQLLAIGALCLAALVAIAILLFGQFGEIEGKTLLTVLAIAGYSLFGVATATALEQQPVWLGPLGLSVSGVGFVLCVGLIWATPEESLLGWLMGTFLILAVALAHASLLLLLTRHTAQKAVRAVRRATLAASSLLALVIILPLLTTWEPSEFYGRLMGVMAVLTILGTLLVPILMKLTTGPGEAKGWPVATEPEPIGGARLDLRYNGRTFVVHAVRHAPPLLGFAVPVWEITRVGREPVALPADEAGAPDRHAALAAAVRQLTTLVDHTPLSSAAERPPDEGIAVEVHVTAQESLGAG